MALESLTALGHGPAGARPPRLLVWALGLALVVGGVGAAALWGEFGLVPFLSGLALLLIYQAKQLRRAGKHGWIWYDGGAGGGSAGGGR